MAKKPMTEEQKQVLRERLALARAARKPKQTLSTEPVSVNIRPDIKPATPTSQDALLETLIKMVDQMQNTRPNPSETNNISLNGNGQIQGVINKYPIDKAFYTDPVEELLAYADKAMPSMAVRTLYDIVWEFTDRPYQSAQNIWYNEPWHVIHLYKRMFDDQGEPVTTLDELGNKDEVVIDWRTGYFFEDDVLVQQYANQHGLVNYDATEIANELRITRMKRWLRDVFFPPKPTSNFNAKQIVVNGQVVEQTVRSKVLGSLPARDQINL
jgi:hypothetical protein